MRFTFQGRKRIVIAETAITTHFHRRPVWKKCIPSKKAHTRQQRFKQRESSGTNDSQETACVIAYAVFLWSERLGDERKDLHVQNIPWIQLLQNRQWKGMRCQQFHSARDTFLISVALSSKNVVPFVHAALCPSACAPDRLGKET